MTLANESSTLEVDAKGSEAANLLLDLPFLHFEIGSQMVKAPASVLYCWDRKHMLLLLATNSAFILGYLESLKPGWAA